MEDAGYKQGDAIRFVQVSEPPNLRQCFVIMPLHQGFDEVYQDIIKPTVGSLGIHPVRADEIYSRNAIIDDIWSLIQKSAWIIADLTGRNPNVFYELGLAHAIGRNPILITQDINDVPFDLRHWRCIVYQQSIRGGTQLAENIKKTISEDRHFYRVPMDYLIDKFSGGFHVEKTESKVLFDGYRGKISHFNELWRNRSEVVKNDLFYRKIRSDGSLINYSGDTVVVEKRMFMEGMYFLTIHLDHTLRIGDTYEYKLYYDICDGFSQKDEYWNFDVETNISEFIYEFDFSGATDVESFIAIRKEKRDSVIQTELPVKQDKKRFIIRDFDLKIGQSILFRWTWCE